jgi:hypothetical protein
MYIHILSLPLFFFRFAYRDNTNVCVKAFHDIVTDELK